MDRHNFFIVFYYLHDLQKYISLKYKRQGSGQHNSGEGSKKPRKSITAKPMRPSLPSTSSSEFGVGEDLKSHTSNVRYLQTVFSRGGNENTIETMMKRTFTKRRHDISTTAPTASDVVADYPPLKTPCGVSLLYYFLFLYLCLL